MGMSVGEPQEVGRRLLLVDLPGINDHSTADDIERERARLIEPEDDSDSAQQRPLCDLLCHSSEQEWSHSRRRSTDHESLSPKLTTRASNRTDCHSGSQELSSQGQPRLCGRDLKSSRDGRPESSWSKSKAILANSRPCSQSA